MRRRLDRQEDAIDKGKLTLVLLLVALGVALLLWWMDGGPAGDVSVSPEGPVADGVVAEGREAPGLPGAVQPPVAIPLFCFKEVFGNQPWTSPVQIMKRIPKKQWEVPAELDPDLPTLQPDENGFVFAADLESALTGSDLATAAISHLLFLPVGAFPTPGPVEPAPPMMTREVPVVPYARVSGRVVDDRGIPLREATVTLATRWQMVMSLLEQNDWPGLVPRPIPLVTDASGRFEAAGLFPGDFTVAKVRHAENLDLDQALNLVAGDNEVELVVTAGSWIRIGISATGFPEGTEEKVWVGLHHHTPGPPGVEYGFIPAGTIGWTLIPPGGDFLFGPLEAGHYDVGYHSRAKDVSSGYLGHFRVLDLGPGETRNLGIVDTQGARQVDVCVIDDETSEPVAGVPIEISGDTPWSSLSPRVQLQTDADGCVSVFAETQFFRIDVTAPTNTRVVGPPYNQRNRGKLSHHQFRLEKHVIPKIPIEIVGPPELEGPEFVGDPALEMRRISTTTQMLTKHGILIPETGIGAIPYPEPVYVRRDARILSDADTLLAHLKINSSTSQVGRSEGEHYTGYAKVDLQADKIQIEVKKAGRLLVNIIDHSGPVFDGIFLLCDPWEGQRIAKECLGGNTSGYIPREDSGSFELFDLIRGRYKSGEPFETQYCPPIGRVELWVKFNVANSMDVPSRYFAARIATIEDLGWKTLDLGTIVVEE